MDRASLVSELEINTRFQVLTDQRNNAMNTIVLLQGELAVARDEIQKLKRQLATVAELKGAVVVDKLPNE